MPLAILSLVASLVIAADPITPSALQDALFPPPSGEAARVVAEGLRAAVPPGVDPKNGWHMIDKETVAFAIEAPGAKSARLGGDFVMLNHGRGYDLLPIGDTGFWARVETIPADTKFSYRFEVDGKKLGGATVAMPGWSDPPESKEVPGREYGEYRPLEFRGKLFANNRTGWVYVPAAYDGKAPAALMIFQDGDAYRKEHVGTVVDNLIAEKAMPVTIVVGLNPGVNDNGGSNRSFEYDSLGDRYATFLADEVFPLLKKDYNLRDDPGSHAIGGGSSGGICAFTAAWERPDLFGRVCSQIGSFTNIRGGNAYPEIVRKADKKPIRVFLHDGTNDLINQFGDWWQANEAMAAALEEKGYAVEFLKDRGFHSFGSCGHVLPQALRATWEGFEP